MNADATSLQPIRIDRQDYRTRGTYVATIAGVHGIARLNYKRERDDLVIAERTELSDSFEGRDVGTALIERMVQDARTEGFKIYALCSFVEDERRGHPEWADVFRVA